MFQTFHSWSGGLVNCIVSYVFQNEMSAVCDKATWPIQNKEELQYSGYEIDNGAAYQGPCMATRHSDEEHDYDEPYFEPASEVDTLLEQLKELSVSNILEKSLRSV